MFEQSIVVAQPANKTWTLGISILAQSFLISAAILLPLVYTNSLPGLSAWLERSLTLPSPEPPKPQPVETTQTARSNTVHPGSPFVAPMRTPTTINLEPEPAAPSDWVISVPGPSTAVANPIARYLANSMPLPKPHDPPPAHEPVKPKAETSAPIPVSSGVQEAKLLRRIVPIYPQIAIVARVEGTVHLMGIISKEGIIRELQVLDGNPLLVKAALDAVRQWVYRPTLLSGQPVEVIAPITVTFKLNH